MTFRVKFRICRRATGRPSVSAIVVLLLCAVPEPVPIEAADGPKKSAGDVSGRLEGQICLQGNPPAPAVVAKFPGGLVTPDESLVVNPAGGGIANVFIYLKDAPRGAAVPLAPREPLAVRMIGFRFEPRCAVVRTGQPLQFDNGDVEPNNVHTRPIRNNEVNWLLKPRAQQELTYDKSERMPILAASDIFPGMRQWHLVLDHPWCAVTDSEGRFEIEGLPPGRHELTLWHERVGYLDRKWTVDIVPGKTTARDAWFDIDRFNGDNGRAVARNEDHLFAGPFDLEQPGDGNDIVVGRRLLEVQLAGRLHLLNRLVGLTAEQRKKLERAGTGEIEHLLDQVQRARAEVQRLGGNRDRLNEYRQEMLPALRERFTTSLFGPETLVGKTQNSVLTPDQQERLRSRSRALGKPGL